eukprot:6309454-Pyramimonas_sp.AAC.1
MCSPASSPPAQLPPRQTLTPCFARAMPPHPFCLKGGAGRALVAKFDELRQDALQDLLFTPSG